MPWRSSTPPTAKRHPTTITTTTTINSLPHVILWLGSLFWTIPMWNFIPTITLRR
ncbi:hypothetical protein CY34DRAFT_807292 [Suillus luteus UH-Slu-Lm8-n1]|uniref:Uncharacterized protein n=1 Tax=Suillus luteus UH-Slu-Lm8-n1 TaxID=930992 RepID=A0A0C9ZRH9_9AGAM|nr:hypothetical protein CY34DRAFT_807292 [Suillus luteus UH-Slu-Lm8-n1]